MNMHDTQHLCLDMPYRREPPAAGLPERCQTDEIRCVERFGHTTPHVSEAQWLCRRIVDFKQALQWSATTISIYIIGDDQWRIDFNTIHATGKSLEEVLHKVCNEMEQNVRNTVAAARERLDERTKALEEVLRA